MAAVRESIGINRTKITGWKSRKRPVQNHENHRMIENTRVVFLLYHKDLSFPGQADTGQTADLPKGSTGLSHPRDSFALPTVFSFR